MKHVLILVSLVLVVSAMPCLAMTTINVPESQANLEAALNQISNNNASDTDWTISFNASVANITDTLSTGATQLALPTGENINFVNNTGGKYTIEGILRVGEGGTFSATGITFTLNTPSANDSFILTNVDSAITLNNCKFIVYNVEAFPRAVKLNGGSGNTLDNVSFTDFHKAAGENSGALFLNGGSGTCSHITMTGCYRPFHGEGGEYTISDAVFDDAGAHSGCCGYTIHLNGGSYIFNDIDITATARHGVSMDFGGASEVNATFNDSNIRATGDNAVRYYNLSHSYNLVFNNCFIQSEAHPVSVRTNVGPSSVTLNDCTVLEINRDSDNGIVLNETIADLDVTVNGGSISTQAALCASIDDSYYRPSGSSITFNGVVLTHNVTLKEKPLLAVSNGGTATLNNCLLNQGDCGLNIDDATVIFYHCTFANMDNGWLISDENKSNNLTVKNSIIDDSVTGGVDLNVTNSTISIDHNLNNSTTNLGTNQFTGSPNFVDKASNNFHIQEPSAASGLGLAGLSAIDFDGDGRPLGLANPDLGMDEIKESISTNEDWTLYN